MQKPPILQINDFLHGGINVYIVLYVTTDRRDDATYGERGGVSGEVGRFLRDGWRRCRQTSGADEEGKWSSARSARHDGEDERHDQWSYFTHVLVIRQRQFVTDFRCCTLGLSLAVKQHLWFVTLFAFPRCLVNMRLGEDMITLHAKLSGAVYCNRSCLWWAGGHCNVWADRHAVSEQPACAQCLRLSERFFSLSLLLLLPLLTWWYLGLCMWELDIRRLIHTVW